MKANKRRAVFKAISWRTMGSVGTALVVFIFTGKLALSIGAGLTEGLVKMLFYYLHERLWERIPWGLEKHPLEAIEVKGKIKPEDMELLKTRLHELGYL